MLREAAVGIHGGMLRRLGSAIVLVGVLAACGGDSGETGNNQSKAGAASASSGDTLACGAETCRRPAELKAEKLCCLDPFSGGCGVEAGSDCRPIPKVDPRCPPPEIMTNFPGANAIKVFGCCTSAGECGTDFGMGCQSRTLACMVVSADRVDQIKHQKCTGEPLPLPANCGMGGVFVPGAAGSGR